MTNNIVLMVSDSAEFSIQFSRLNRFAIRFDSIHASVQIEWQHTVGIRKSEMLTAIATSKTSNMINRKDIK